MNANIVRFWDTKVNNNFWKTVDFFLDLWDELRR